jgi:hypothetical protein
MFKEKYLEAKVLKARIAKLELWSPRRLLLRHLKWRGMWAQLLAFYEANDLGA